MGGPKVDSSTLEASGDEFVQFTVETPPSAHLSEPSDGQYEDDSSHYGPPIALSKTTAHFREAKISLAVDISGSTFGEVLSAEIKAVNGVCSLFPSALRSTIRILPWSDAARKPIHLESLGDLESSGGTDPNVLLHDDACRYELQNSSFWFLMTDGEIQDIEIRRFARGLVEYGLHGLASVIAIFGQKGDPPSRCNISVGLSVFAVSPHCAFLYTDIITGHTYILQTKGCFSALLPKEARNPILAAGTQWTDLPQTSYENLARVPIPPPQLVSKDEVVLKDNSRVDISTLLSSSAVDREIASRILDHEDNLKTIALTAKLKGQGEQLRKWLDNVERTTIEAFNPDNIERPQDDQKSDLLTEAMEKLMASEKSNDNMGDLQREIREANARDMKVLDSRIGVATETAVRRKSSSSHARRVSSSALSSAADNISSVDYGFHNQNFVRLASIAQTPTGLGVHAHSTSLMNPGFHRPDVQKDYYKGNCMICSSSEHVMALLFQKPQDQSKTANFPQPGSSSQLVYPLTMGNYPETDIISSFLACDPCSFQIAKRGRIPSGHEISATLPLVSFAKNRNAWLETLNLATQKRFSLGDLPLVLLAILYTKLERLLEESDSTATINLRPALNWECSNLLQEVQLQDTSDIRKFNSVALQTNLLRNFRCALDDTRAVELLMYPIDGFIVANVALSNSYHKTQISAPKRQRVVFLRFLYHLTEQYHKLSCESGGMVLQATKTLILVLDEPVGPRSLLALGNLRQFSGQFKNAQELLQALQNRIGRRHGKFQPRKLSISVKDLVGTPFLDAQSLRNFRRLGALFSWIEHKAGHAIAAFLHYLFCMETSVTVPNEHFVEIRSLAEMCEAMSKPEEMSAKMVEDLIKDFPPIL